MVVLSVTGLLVLIILKIILAVLSVFYLHPVYGRINGLLSFVDFYVILMSSKRSLPISAGYAITSFLAAITFNPYYN